MNILALETSQEACSVALCRDEQVWQYHQLAPRQQVDQLLPAITSLLNEADLKLSDLDAIAYGQGPGSFTGIRLVLGVVQGLAYGASIPVIPVSSLQVLAQGAYRLTGSKEAYPAFDARLSEVYWGAYCLGDGELMQPALVDSLMSPEAASPVLSDSAVGVGCGWDSYDVILSKKIPCQNRLDCLNPNAIDLLAIAKYHYANNELQSVIEAAPLYLRDQVAHQKN